MVFVSCISKTKYYLLLSHPIYFADFMREIEFRATVQLKLQNPYVLVSKQNAESLKNGWKKPMPVIAQINGIQKTWRINMMPKGDGDFFLYLNGKIRKSSGTKVGDEVSVHLSFDDSYQGGPTHPMPQWFSVPLSKNRKAQTAWNDLSPSRKKEILRYFSWLKSDEARERNVTQALLVLSGNEGRFMGRTWNNGK